jgi:hypothetical protein
MLPDLPNEDFPAIRRISGFTRSVPVADENDRAESDLE